MGDDKRYKKLEINFDYMVGWIEAFCSQKGYSDEKISKSGNAQVTNYSVTHSTGSFEASFFTSAGNRYTIKHNYGSDNIDSSEFADFVVERLGSANKPIDDNKGFTLKMEQHDFDAFMELLIETNEGDLDVISTSHAPHIQHKVKSKQYGDDITIHYYATTRNLFIQGKRLQLFNKATDILAGKCDLKEVVNAEIRYDRIDTTCEKVLEQMKESLGAAYNYLTQTQIAIMSNSFKFYRVEMPSLDYSNLVQPMCRAMDGFMLKLLEEFEDKGIDIYDDEVDGIGYFFHGKEHRTKPLLMKEQFASKIENEMIEKQFNRIYNWYHKNRHQYSHSGPHDDTTAIIKDRRVADKLFEEAINLYKDTYDIVMREIRKG